MATEIIYPLLNQEGFISAIAATSLLAALRRQKTEHPKWEYLTYRVWTQLLPEGVAQRLKNKALHVDGNRYTVKAQDLLDFLEDKSHQYAEFRANLPLAEVL